jgi:hypothetical protein
LKTAQKKTKSTKEIRAAVKKQLGVVKRNIKNIHKLLIAYKRVPSDAYQYKYFLVIQQVSLMDGFAFLEELS